MVLAAGVSNRMGRNKLLLEIEGESLLRRAVGRAIAAGLDPVVVVLGHEADRAREELSGLICRPVVNPEYARGVNASLSAGIAALPAGIAAAVVMLADMPFVTADMIGTLVRRFRETTAPLVVSDYEGVNAPPILYDRSLFAELGAMEGEGCGKQVVKRHRGEAVSVPWPGGALSDVDVPEDYERLRSGASSG